MKNLLKSLRICAASRQHFTMMFNGELFVHIWLLIISEWLVLLHDNNFLPVHFHCSSLHNRNSKPIRVQYINCYYRQNVYFRISFNEYLGCHAISNQDRGAMCGFLGFDTTLFLGSHCSEVAKSYGALCLIKTFKFIGMMYQPIPWSVP